MKKTALFAGMILLFSVMVTAQQPYLPSNNPTVAAITSKYTLKEINHDPLTDEKVFPALGTYQCNVINEMTGTIHITIDPDNKGLVWVEGLPQGKIKAMLRMSPATYKIPAQKTEEGTDVPEGAMIYDQDSKTLSICIGRPYDEKNPLSVFSTPVEEEQPAVQTEVKTKTSHQKKQKTTAQVKEEKKVKPWIVTATKVEPQSNAAK